MSGTLLDADALAELRKRFEHHTALSNPDTQRLFDHLAALANEELRQRSIASVVPALTERVEALVNALQPFAVLATEDGRAPFKMDSIDPCTTDGLSFDESSDDAQIPLRVRVGDIRSAQVCVMSRVNDPESNE